MKLVMGLSWASLFSHPAWEVRLVLAGSGILKCEAGRASAWAKVWRPGEPHLLASHCRCFKARAVCEWFVRLIHLSLSCNTTTLMDFTCGLSHTELHTEADVSHHTNLFPHSLVAMSLHGSAWYAVGMKETFNALTAKATTL